MERGDQQRVQQQQASTATSTSGTDQKLAGILEEMKTLNARMDQLTAA
jgi:hypothetical protein